MQLQGKIKLINETQTFGASGFRKRELVLSTDLDTDYPQHILVEFVQDKVDVLDAYKVGQDVTVSLNLRGREWTNQDGVDKYFNSIQGRRIELAENVEGATDDNFERTTAAQGEESDDLPF